MNAKNTRQSRTDFHVASTNPFDDDSCDGNESVESCYYDSISESTSLLSGSLKKKRYTPNRYHSKNVVMKEIDSTNASTEQEQNTSAKRVAPLTFDVSTATENPALTFKQIHEDNNFLSPLESLLINNSSIEGEEDADYDEPSIRMKSDSNNDRIDNYQHKIVADVEESEDLWFPTKENLEETVDKNWVVETQNVLNRMDSVAISISSAINSREIKLFPKDTENKKIKHHRRKSRKEFEGNGKPIVGSLKSQIVLNKIETHVKDNDLTMDYRNPRKPWGKMIILEQLGTASSWVILLLPYIAFLIALILDSNSKIWNVVSSPLPSDSKCSDVHFLGHNTSNFFPISPCPPRPCAYRYESIKDSRIISMAQRSNANILSCGIAFTSGPINEIPVMSKILLVDVEFNGISNDTVDLASKGSVYYSIVLLQQQIENYSYNEKEWRPVSVSKPDRLDLVCDEAKSDRKWNCQIPNVNFLFTSLPETYFFQVGSLRVDTILYNDENKNCMTVSNLQMNDTFGGKSNMNMSDRPSLKAGKTNLHVLDKKIITSKVLQNPDDMILELAFAARYSITHRRPIYPHVEIIVRIITLVVTVVFLSFWLWRMGFDGFLGIELGSCSCCVEVFSTFFQKYEQNRLSRRGKEMLWWWENKWFLLPERKFIFLLLLALMMIQNPILVYLYFHPKLYGNAYIRFLADASIGIGINLVLCLWLCLFHGLRYHTSEIARKRAICVLQALELQKAAQYLASGNPKYESCEYTREYLSSYYEQYGDIYGNFNMINKLRMKHDPCDNWLTFILPKLLLLFIGSLSVVSTAFSQFPESFSTNKMVHNLMSRYSLQFYRKIFVIGSLVQVIVLLLWVFLIIKSAIATGKRLRRQTFLLTRPAQLCFRILANIMIGGIASAVIPSFANFIFLIRKWSSHEHSSYHTTSIVSSDSSSPIIDIISKILYATSAPGKILYLTVAIISVAFIFLPPLIHDAEKETEDSSTNLSSNKQENQRRDKRMVITLAHYTHTWRIFPCPLQKIRFQIGKNSLDCFQIDQNFRYHKSSFGRGAIYRSNYVPVFCVEIALWLLECSWQAYYSTTESKTYGNFPGKMNLQLLGLHLEAVINDEQYDTSAFVSSNLTDQIDGEKDSIIVISFRGTVSVNNVVTDLKMNQVPLPEIFQSGLYDTPEFQMNIVEDIESNSHSDVSITRPKMLERRKNFSKNILKKAPLTRIAFPLVHGGFLDSYTRMRDKIIANVVEVMQRQLSKSIMRQVCLSSQTALVLPKIYVTGHSFGGAMAQLLALDIANNIEITNIIDGSGLNSKNEPTIKRRNSFPNQQNVTIDSKLEQNNSVDFLNILHDFGIADNIEAPKRLQPPIAVYTFGQPRLGNHAFARLYKKFVPHTFRVAIEGDAITALPFAKICGIFKLYKHAGLEVMLDKEGTGLVLVGPTVVETLFRFSKVRTKVSRHFLDSYRTRLECSLTQDELQEFYKGHGGRTLSQNRLPDWVTQKGRM